MPYSRLSWDLIGASGRGAATSTFYAYRTIDTYAQVRASGYFNDVATLLRPGDLIYLTTDTGTVPSNSVIEVATTTGGVVTTRGARMGAGNALPVLAARMPVQATAVTNTDFTLAIPTGVAALRATFLTTVAFTGGTPTFALGSTAGGAELVAAVGMASIGRVSMTLLNTAPAFGTGTLFGRLNQASAPTAVGTGVLIFEYLDV